jgi:hypothetical protein
VTARSVLLRLAATFLFLGAVSYFLMLVITKVAPPLVPNAVLSTTVCGLGAIGTGTVYVIAIIWDRRTFSS